MKYNRYNPSTPAATYTAECPSCPPDVHSLNPPVIVQMQSEIDHLREALHKRDTQIEQLTQLLAMQTQQNHQLIAQLPASRPTLAERIGKLFVKFSANQT